MEDVHDTDQTVDHGRKGKHGDETITGVFETGDCDTGLSEHGRGTLEGGVIMAGFTAKHKNGRVSFTYSGDLQECIDKAEKELEAKQGSQEQVFLTWQYERAKKALNTYNRRIADLKDFIPLAKEELERKKQEAAGHEKDV